MTLPARPDGLNMTEHRELDQWDNIIVGCLQMRDKAQQALEIALRERREIEGGAMARVEAENLAALRCKLLEGCDDG